MSDQRRDQAVTAARNLTRALEDVDAELKRLNAYGRTSRHLIAGLAVSLLLDVILTIVVAVFAVQAHEANSRATIAGATASAIHSSQISACQIGNQLRVRQVGLWEHLIAVSQPPPQETAAQKRQRAKTAAAFLVYVKKTFPRLNCQQVYRLPH